MNSIKSSLSQCKILPKNNSSKIVLEGGGGDVSDIFDQNFKNGKAPYVPNLSSSEEEEEGDSAMN